MTEALLALLPAWGPWLLGITTFLSCLAIPVPSSIMMIAAGAFAASGDLSLPSLMAAAYGGAVLGDQLGFFLGRHAAQLVPGRLLTGAGGKRAALVAKAREKLQESGGIAVFFTRWLFSALGPWINFAAGASGFGHGRFTVAGVAGEAVWVTVYVGLGMAFGANLEAATELATDALGFLAAGTVALALGWWLYQAARAR